MVYSKDYAIDIFQNSIARKVDEIFVLGGMTNVNFLIVSKSEKFVLRLPGINSNLMIDRKKEKHIQTITSNANLNVPLVYFDDLNGVKITKFLESAKTLNAGSIKSYIKDIASAIKKLHNSTLDFKFQFNPFDEMDKYISLVKRDLFVKENKLLLQFDKSVDVFYKLRDKIFNINKNIYGEEVLLSPTHGDLVPENILYHNGKIFIIDWEYAGLNDPCWDIASLFLESEFNFYEQKTFFNYYDLDQCSMSKVDMYKSIQDILWVAWSLAKTKDDDCSYLDYAKKRLNNLFARI